jgi:hypothetical protein
MNKVGPLAADLGETGIRAMDEQAIQMQIVSWGRPPRWFRPVRRSHSAAPPTTVIPVI